MSATERARRTAVFLLLLLVILGSIALLIFVIPPDATAPGRTADEEESPEREPEAPVSPPIEREPEKGDKIYLVVDDAGHDVAELKPYLSLPVPLTVAVLPGRKESQVVVKAALAAGKEIILHLPMEPVGKADPGAGAIRSDQTDEEIRSILRSHLEDLPGIIGVNNHMGSRATADSRVMDVVMSVLAEEGLFFLDSRTTAKSVAREAAKRHGVAFRERNVFLDNDRSDDAVLRQLSEAATLAGKEGYSVAIGHVTSPTVARAVAKHHAELARKGIAVAPLSELF